MEIPYQVYVYYNSIHMILSYCKYYFEVIHIQHIPTLSVQRWFEI